MPTRYLKPGIRDSGPIEGLSAHPDAEILYYRLLVSVDDFGRTDARPLMIKALCFPIRMRVNADKCMQMLAALVDVGLILIYTVDNKEYLQITKWDNKPRAAFSKYPPPPDDVYTCMQMLPANRELKLKPEPKQNHQHGALNGEAVELIPLAAKGVEWGVSREYLAELEHAYPAVDGPATLREIRAWCVSNPGRCKTERGVKRFINRWFEKVQNA